MERLLDLISPFASLPIFLALNAIICLISIYWVFANVRYEKNPKYHKTIQAIGLVVSLFVISILWIKQWNIGDLLAFYVLFASTIFTASFFLTSGPFILPVEAVTVNAVFFPIKYVMEIIYAYLITYCGNKYFIRNVLHF